MSKVAVVAAVLVWLASLPMTGAKAGATSDVIAGEYIVLFKERVRPEHAAIDLAREHGLQMRHTYSQGINGSAASVPEGRLRALQRDPRVASVGQDRLVHAISQTLPTGIDRIDAEPGRTGTTGAGVTVAVLDTGIDLDHPDLQANIVGGIDFTGENGTGDDNSDGSVKGHGTLVAGIIAARDNNLGVVGVAPDARLFSVKVLGHDGTGSLADIIAGIDFVTGTRTDGDPSNDIDVANMSLVATCSVCVENSSDATIMALQNSISASIEAGITYVVAAGNNGSETKDTVPGAFGGGGAVSIVIIVSALDDRNGAADGNCTDAFGTSVDCFASFSNFGDDIDLIGPGVGILSTSNGGGTGSLTGTSASAPHVAGVAALYLSLHGTPAAQNLDGDGIASVGDVVGAALVAAGEAAPPGGWPGDPDALTEPLVDAEAVAPPVAGPDPTRSPAWSTSDPHGSAATDCSPSETALFHLQSQKWHCFRAKKFRE